ncbi:MAG TPA: DNA repair protein RecO [Candidatus Saccharimonadaceae bacterium]|nr:DNA repair protein RecO [Candidatus Saccharimonadaceae bacterium]
MKTSRTRAIVLRRTNYGEADRILWLLTPDGRRNVMARGVRREKSKLAGGIELFSICDVVIGEGKGELGVLTSSRLVQFYRHIIEDYDRLQFGYEAIRLVSKASETIDEPEWYDLLAELLMALDSTTIALELTQTWFYLRYATLLGHQLNLSIDVNGDRLDAEQTYRYDASEQGLLPWPNGSLTAEHIKLLRLVASRPLKILAQIGGLETILSDCFQVAREHAAV